MIAVFHGREILGLRYFQWTGIRQQQDEQARQQQMYPARKYMNGIVPFPSKSHDT
jgi:hypothetical protein